MADTTTGGHPLSYPSENDQNWFSTWESFAQSLSNYLDALGRSEITTIDDSNDNEVMTFASVSSAVNYIEVTNAATGNNPIIEAKGDDTNIGITISPKGSGALVLDNLTLPASDGSNGQILKTDGAGQLSFITAQTELVNDTTPQLGGNLDPNGKRIAGDLIPNSSGAYDLGSTSLIWDSVYASNIFPSTTIGNGSSSFNINTGSGGDITCDVLTANSLNLGDDNLSNYDEGSWTPVIEGVTTAGTGTYSTQLGAYTRIGDIVHVQCYLLWTGHTGTGPILITGLPNTIEANGGGSTDAWVGACMTSNYDWASTGFTSIAVWGDSDNDGFRIGQSKDNGAVDTATIDSSASLWFSAVYKTSDA